MGFSTRRSFERSNGEAGEEAEKKEKVFRRRFGDAMSSNGGEPRIDRDAKTDGGPSRGRTPQSARDREWWRCKREGEGEEEKEEEVVLAERGSLRVFARRRTSGFRTQGGARSER